MNEISSNPSLQALAMAYRVEVCAVLLPHGDLQTSLVKVITQLRKLGMYAEPHVTRGVLERIGDISSLAQMIADEYSMEFETSDTKFYLDELARKIRQSRKTGIAK